MDLVEGRAIVILGVSDTSFFMVPDDGRPLSLHCVYIAASQMTPRSCGL
jgi:hypothetical protein